MQILAHIAQAYAIAATLVTFGLFVCVLICRKPDLLEFLENWTALHENGVTCLVIIGIIIMLFKLAVKYNTVMVTIFGFISFNIYLMIVEQLTSNIRNQHLNDLVQLYANALAFLAISML